MKNISVTVFFIFFISFIYGDDFNSEINANLYPSFSNSNEFNYSGKKQSKIFFAGNKKVKKNIADRSIRTAFQSSYGAVLSGSLAPASYRPYNAIKFSSKMPNKINDAAANPLFFYMLMQLRHYYRPVRD